MTALYAFTAEQEELRSTLRKLLLARPSARAVYDDDASAPDVELWTELVGLGIAGLGVDESAGGSGGDVIDLVVVAEELGRAVAPVPFVGNAVAAIALARSANDAASVLAAGERVGGFAPDGPGLVYDASGADLLVVPVGDGVGMVHDPIVTAQRTVDRTRPVAACRWDAADVEPLGPEVGQAELRTLMAILHAAEAAGVAADALDRTASYTVDRRQFGVPIGTFQAVKHRLADMLVDVECARSAAYAAAWAWRDGGDDVDLLAHMAQAVATEAAIGVVSAAIQLHGGVGVTWEHDLHLHLRRAKGLELAGGTPGWHYEQIADRLLGQKSSG